MRLSAPELQPRGFRGVDFKLCMAAAHWGQDTCEGTLKLPEAAGHKWVSTGEAGFMARKGKMLSGAEGPAPLPHQGVPLPWQICSQR